MSPNFQIYPPIINHEQTKYFVDATHQTSQQSSTKLGRQPSCLYLNRKSAIAAIIHPKRKSPFWKCLLYIKNENPTHPMKSIFQRKVFTSNVCFMGEGKSLRRGERTDFQVQEYSITSKRRECSLQWILSVVFFCVCYKSYSQTSWWHACSI